MPKECRYFVQHAWKEGRCANCFKSREEHQRMNVSTGCVNVKVNTNKIQSILKVRVNENKDQVDGKKKCVVFSEDLTEVIGYGGDNFDGESLDESSDEDIRKYILEETIVENEEDRQLNNLTRSNTNFNSVTANLNIESSTPIINGGNSTKDLSNLMLGNIQKDANGKKTTLLVSVTPFGSDNSTFHSRTIIKTPTTTATTTTTTPMTTDQKNQNVETNSKNIVSNLLSRLNHETVNSSVEKEKSQIELMKIVDMPLIESNSISVVTNKISNTLTSNLDKRKVNEKEKKLDEIDNKYLETTVELNKVEEIISKDEDLTIPDMRDREVEGESSNVVNFDEKMLKNSREDAGVPDGKADEDEISEPASLASLTDQNSSETTVMNKIPAKSFLHSKISTSEPLKFSLKNNTNTVVSAGSDIPCQKIITTVVNKIPISSSLHGKILNTKPLKISQKDINHSTLSGSNDDLCYKEDDKDDLEIETMKDSSTVVVDQQPEVESRRRMAPKPPENPPGKNLTETPIKLENQTDNSNDESLNNIFLRNPNRNVKSDCPVVREIEKRESLILFGNQKLKKTDDETLNQSCNINTNDKNISLSQNNLVTFTNPTSVFNNDYFDDSKKIKSKSRFSLKKLLRMGGLKKDIILATDSCSDNSITLKLKTRPEISHPSELDGANVQILRHNKLINKNDNNEESKTTEPSTQSQTTSPSSSSHLGKPPPPPKNHIKKNNDLESKQQSNDNNSWKSTNSSHNAMGDLIYSNLAEEDVAGEMRYGLTPSKPQRTSSIRSVKVVDANTKGSTHQLNPNQTASSELMDSVDSGSDVQGANSECDFNVELRNMVCQDELTSRARICRRSLINRSLEDNYSAVMITNYESLVQLLKQLVQIDQLIIPSNLLSLKTTNLRLNEFIIDINSYELIGEKIFVCATWNEHKLSLCFSPNGLTSLPIYKEYFLVPIVEFIDSFPHSFPDIISQHYIHNINNQDVTISVLNHLRVNTLKSLSISNEQQSCLILLQLINALKSLQVCGIEEFPKNLNHVVLCQVEKDPFYHLYLLPSFHVDINDDKEEYVSLCQSALIALELVNLKNKFPVIIELLLKERAVSLSQVKAVLEYSLWGPVDVIFSNWKEREMILQRWLDLERAKVLHTLIKHQSPLRTIADQCQLTFLVHTTAKILCEASVLLDDQRSI